LPAQAPTKDEALAAMRRAADFYRNKVSTEGGYHFYYTADLSYGRSESAEGPTQVEVQREATPIVALAYLDAYDLTGDRVFLDHARAAAHALVRGQLCSGGWDYLIEFDPAKRNSINTAPTITAATISAASPTWTTTSRRRPCAYWRAWTGR
jgi:hypothetical protein